MYNHTYMHHYPHPSYATNSIYCPMELYARYQQEVHYMNYLNALSYSNQYEQSLIKDYGPAPMVLNINSFSKQNNTFRTALWTGTHLQVTLMSIGVGEDIGLEMHPNVDQFLRIEQGQGVVEMGDRKENLNFITNVYDDSAIFLPAGTWHNVKNTGHTPLKLYSIYAPPNHPFGTVHETKADAINMEQDH